MAEARYSDAFLANNEKSLRRLVRAIGLSQGEFSLILVTCNNLVLREQILQRLQVEFANLPNFHLRKLVLPNNAENIYTTIKTQLQGEKPSALIVLGLESHLALDELLYVTNLVRDEFRKRKPFPLVLWVNDEVLQKLLRLAPDFANWIGVPVRFEIATVDLPENYATKLDSDPILQQNQRSLTSLARAIAFSQGTFSLVLVQCNYLNLQQRILQELQPLLPELAIVQQVVLPHNATSLSNIRSEFNIQQPAALIVLGLESVDAIDELLATMDRTRDEFCKLYTLPIVLLVNDQVLNKFIRLAPDFASWAATPIRFDMTTDGLLAFLSEETDWVFAKIFEGKRGITAKTPRTPRGGEREISLSLSLERVWNYELSAAIRELHGRGVSLSRELEAGLEFIFGLDDYINWRIDSALNYFHESLRFWQLRSASEVIDKQDSTVEGCIAANIEVIDDRQCPSLREGVLLYYLGLCYCRRAESQQNESHIYWSEAKLYFQRSLSVFEALSRMDIVAQFIGDLCEVLQHLQAWDELEVIAEKALGLHQDYGSLTQLACDYSFLAQVVAQQNQWSKANRYAQVALLYLTEARDNGDGDEYLFPLLLALKSRLILAIAQRNLGEEEVAQSHQQQAVVELAEALENSDYSYDAHRYLSLLRQLRNLYFEQGKYLEAFYIKQKRRSVEKEYGLRAFIGAGRLQPQKHLTNPIDILADSIHTWRSLTPTPHSPLPTPLGQALEITASGRDRDINNLIEKISHPDQKLIVIHGESGVGKSSTVSAGLVPALQNQAIGDQIALPVLLQNYTDWVQELGKAIVEALGRYVYAYPNTPASILQWLRDRGDKHLLTILIFDQFEEFFFNCPRSAQQEFDIFLHDCLNIPFVRMIISLRSDYLHRLLDLRYLSSSPVVNNNILDKQIRYQINNLSLPDAKTFIKTLTERSHFDLESALIDALIEDLAAQRDSVRPIELQLLGSQLQDRRITKLQHYKQYRPNKLIELYIQEIIKDCGLFNERAALLVLYLLTDEQNQRTIKTYSQLAQEMSEFESSDKLELILNIFAQSGLIIVYQSNIKRYQLSHDYLVILIRNLQQKESGILTELRLLRNSVSEREVEISHLKSELRENKHFQRQLTQSKKKQTITLKVFLAGALTTIFTLTASVGIVAVYLSRQSSLSEIRSLATSSNALFTSNKKLDALKESVKAAAKLQQSWLMPDRYIQVQVITALYQAVVGLSPDQVQKNIIAHDRAITSVSFSPQADLIATASRDKTVKLWRYDGKLLHAFSGHQGSVLSVSLSYDGNFLISGGADKTVKLWRRDGKLMQNWRSQSAVLSVDFSPDGQAIAIASQDGSIKLNSREGQLKNILQGHKGAANRVRFSPDGQFFASAGDDKTVKIWSDEGKLIRTLTGHQSRVYDLAWSPSGEIASTSNDNTVIIWSRNGKKLKVIKGDGDRESNIGFNPKGDILAVASGEEIRLWDLNGVLLANLKGYKQSVTSFNFAPDGNTLVLGDASGSLVLLSLENIKLENLLNIGCDLLQDRDSCGVRKALSPPP